MSMILIGGGALLIYFHVEYSTPVGILRSARLNRTQSTNGVADSDVSGMNTCRKLAECPGGNS